jgi:hypothetical protein
MHESEKDIPVGFGCSICGYDSTDHWKDDLPPLHGDHAVQCQCVRDVASQPSPRPADSIELIPPLGA